MTKDEALQMALDTLKSLQAWPETPENFKRVRAIESIEEALAQPERAECDGGQCGIGGYCKQCPKTQPEPEPVAWMHNFIDDVIIKNRPTDITCNAGRWTALYTAPPQREWQGLTDEEYEAMAEQYVTNCYFDTLKYAKAIEAKLKDNNYDND